MDSKAVSSRMPALYESVAQLLRFFSESAYGRRDTSRQICDFAFGNPHEMPMPAYVDALQKVIEPRNKDWFAYKLSEREAQTVIGATISERLGQQYEAGDICVTNGASAGLTVVLNSIVDRGDEVIFITPHWFFYEGMIMGAGGTAVKVAFDSTRFDLDLAAIKGAITSRTRAIIINSPNNPTGKIYSHETLADLGLLLEAASVKNGRTIYLISDESYHQIIFDGREYVSPASVYPNTFIVYTYGKVHLTPGQRIGYIALAPQMRDREEVLTALNFTQMIAGWSFPNAILQYAIADLVKLSIDIPQLQGRRDRFISALGEIGYETNRPEGTFYLLVKSPLADDWEFVEQLAHYDVFCLPGIAFGLPGYFRVSLTGNDEMVERSIPGFAAAFRAIS